MKPFVEVDDIRVFNPEVDIAELKWHWDHEDRTIEVLANDGDWELQFDNQLPQKLILGTTLFIQAGAWHRVIKNTAGHLIIKVTKHDANLTRAPTSFESSSANHEQLVPIRQHRLG